MQGRQCSSDETNQEFVAERSCRNDQGIFIGRLSLIRQLTLLLFTDDGVTNGQEGPESIDVFVIGRFQDRIRRFVEELIPNGTFLECHHVLQGRIDLSSGREGK